MASETMQTILEAERLHQEKLDRAKAEALEITAQARREAQAEQQALLDAAAEKARRIAEEAAAQKARIEREAEAEPVTLELPQDRMDEAVRAVAEAVLG